MRRGRRLPLEHVQPYLIEVEQPRAGRAGATHSGTAPLRWLDLFANNRPVEIEVGFGKGLFLVTSAAARPDTNFLGIEIERKYTLFTANRLAKRELKNVRLAACDARWFLSELVVPASVQALHVFFPDPWWKTRHRKRRLFTAEFAAQCVRVLEPEGRLHLVSDVAEYFHETVELLTTTANLEAISGAALPAVADGFLTNFERKYRLEGRPIHRALFRKL